MAASSCFSSLGLLLLVVHSVVLLALAGTVHGHPPCRWVGAERQVLRRVVPKRLQHRPARHPERPGHGPSHPGQPHPTPLPRLLRQRLRRLVLLDDDLPAIQSEKNVPANDNSARGFPVVDDIKSALEHACPGIISCADILALAAEISVELAGSPRWRVLLGRRDGTTTNIESANNLPNFFDTLDVLQEKFRNVNLDDTDLVALQGAHTFGKVQCQFTRQNCTNGQAADSLENLDHVTPKTFDNKYYGNILQGRSQLDSDQVMLSDPAAATTTAPIVHRFAGDQKDFFRNFAASMIKMGNISPLTGSNGEIRKNCRRVNSKGY